MTEIFVKFHKSAYDSGLLGALGAERTHVLIALATHMNTRGECFPSQEIIAEKLGVRRETVNRRIKSLTEFRWQGEPIVVKSQKKSQRSGRFQYNVYQLTEACGFSFGRESEGAKELPCDNDDIDRVTLN